MVAELSQSSSVIEACLFDFLHVKSQIDQLLQQAISEQKNDEQLPFYLTDNSVTTALWSRSSLSFSFSPSSRMTILAELFDLTDFEMSMIMLGCMTHFDPRYGPLFAKLQPVSISSPTLNFALLLFCPGQFERNAQRASLLPNAPLLRSALIIQQTELRTGTERGYTTNMMIYHYLLGHDVLPEPLYWPPPRPQTYLASQPLDEALLQHWNFESNSFPRLIELRVGSGVDSSDVCATLAQQMNLRALVIDCALLPTDEHKRKQCIVSAFTAACLFQALLIVQNQDIVENTAILSRLVEDLSETHGLPLCSTVTHSSSGMPFPALARWIINVELPNIESREQQLHLLVQSYSSEAINFGTLVQRVALSANDMEKATVEADIYRRQRGGDNLTEGDLRRAMNRRARQNFGELAQRVEPQRTWSDLVVNDELKQQLKEILSAVDYREQTLAQGFDKKVGGATGISALFHGDSGTGKTLVAEVLAGQIGVDLIRVDLSTVVNKYIGETEKNLAKIFDLAAQDAGVLFFDEADALFGKRSETKDAKDRHANIEIAYLLQRLEKHPGLVILATNHRSHMDDAFTRRFTFITHFTYPEPAQREDLWRSAWPTDIALAQDLDFSTLAKAQLTGANIRNIALLSAWFAKGELITVEHIQRATKRELAKMGRLQL